MLFVDTKNKFERITFRSAPMRDADEQRISRLFTVGGIVQRVGISLFGLCVATGQSRLTGALH